ncbi:MAG: hypothetical protein LC793_14985, partial [Thermomicrobia bacterium]|nr:hypothetical protein [Thermomicrobia bacterium]
KIQHLEKVASERIYGERYDVWDIHTDVGRWWVITRPTNLYSQDEFKSMDYAFSFHVGLTTRMMARNHPQVPDEERDRLATSWRRWIQSADALDHADEAEEFQSVGMRCRECLLAFIREVASDEMVPEGESPPKRADFIHWSEHIADTIASGSGSADLRSYLKNIAKSTWQLVAWLTHAANATRLDGRIAVDATEHILASFAAALIRFERGIPDRCPQCSSYQLTSDYRPEISEESPYVTRCEACGWEKSPNRVDEERSPI